MKYKVFYIVFLSFFFVSCSMRYHSEHSPSKKNIYEILSQMPDIECFPDYEYLYPKGDSICIKIIDCGTEIVPYLIDKITDTTQTKVYFSDQKNYKVGDAAVFLLDAIYIYDLSRPSSLFNISDIILENFFDKKPSTYFFQSIYASIFLLNSEEKNDENRKKLQRLLKRQCKAISLN